LLAGVVNVRGKLQLCVRLEGLLGLDPPAMEPQAAAPKARLLVVERAGARWAFRVDDVAGVHRVPGRSLRDVPATVSGADMRATVALFGWQDKTVGLLDEARLLDGLPRRISG
jgi:chemotaxis-related protein WspD